MCRRSICLSTILGDGRSSRLYRRVREEAGLAFGVSAYSYTPGDPGIFGIDATTEPEKRVATEELVLKIIEEIQHDGVTSEELAKAKKISLSHHLAALTTMRGQASDLGSNWFLTRNLNFTRDYLEAAQTFDRRGHPPRRAEISDAQQSHDRSRSIRRAR